jgi:hypothetical protein
MPPFVSVLNAAWLAVAAASVAALPEPAAPSEPVAPEQQAAAEEQTTPERQAPREGPTAPAEPVLEASTEQDWTYLAIAWHTGLAGVCEHISPTACDEWLFNSPGYQIAFARARCYQGVAENTRDASVCAKVETISRPWHDGSGYSAEACAASVAAGPEKERWHAPPKRALRAVLARHGYALDEIVRECAERMQVRRAAAEGEGLRERMADATYPADVLRDHYFGPFRIPPEQRPYAHCIRFFDVSMGPDGISGEPVIAQREPAQIDEAFDSHIYAIFRSLALLPEFRRRIVSSADH